MSDVLLTLDTSTPTGSVALSREGELIAELLLNTRQTHTDLLLDNIRFILQQSGLTLQDVTAFGVVLGPGSFTGLRVGVATVKGLAMACKRPVVGISSLETLAMNAPATALPVCVMLDARKQEVYACRYQWQDGWPVPLGAEQVLAPEKLLSQMSGEILFVGSGAVLYRTLIVRVLGNRAHFVPWPLHQPRSALASVLAWRELQSKKDIPLELLAPRYIRLSEAEIAYAKRVAEEGIEG